MASCAWCGREEADFLVARRDRLGNETFAYLRCAGCGLIRLEPRPPSSELLRYYPEDYEAFQSRRENPLFRWGRRRLWYRRLQAIRHYLPRAGRALDVGCGTGEFLEIIRRLGWDGVGIEPNPWAARQARVRLEAGVVQEIPLEEAAYPPETFDLITLWDVLEHLDNPPAALRRLAGWLRPDGLLAVGVPNLESWDARFFGPAWIGWDAPRHLHLFPDSTLRGMLAETGFSVLAAPCLYGGYGPFILSLDFALQERYREKGRFLRRLVALRPGRYLLWPYFSLAERLGKGSIRTYLCRRSREAPGLSPPRK
ncbi:MAG: class I SAM-dependent methyltransferase [Chloroflexia bacterium]